MIKFIPEMNEDYWFYNEDGELWCFEFTYAGIDEEHLENGNCYKTKEDAIIDRMANPTKPSDYGLSITYNTPEEMEDIFKKIEDAKND